MLERLWIDKIHPSLKQAVMDAKDNHVPVTYNPLLQKVTINYGPLALRVYNAKTGQLLIMS
jgi:hypothetical protein